LLALDNTSDGVMVADMQAPGQPIIHVNRAFESITGHPGAEAIGKIAGTSKAVIVFSPKLAQSELR